MIRIQNPLNMFKKQEWQTGMKGARNSLCGLIPCLRPLLFSILNSHIQRQAIVLPATCPEDPSRPLL